MPCNSTSYTGKGFLHIDHSDKVDQVELQKDVTKASKNLMSYGDFLR